MKKIGGSVFIVFVLLFVLSLAVFAAGKTVYVRSDVVGAGTNGVYGSFGHAIAALENGGGSVVFLDEVTVPATLIEEQSGDLTITAADGGGMLLTGNLTFAKNTNDNTITIDCPLRLTSARAIFGGFNNIVFTDKVTVTGELHFYGGVDAKASSTHGVNRDDNDGPNREAITELPYSITVSGGSFAKFHGGNRRSGVTCLVGAIAAPLTVTINGGTFGSAPTYAANDPIKTECIFSLSGQSILADDATLTVNGGEFLAPVYAQGHLGEMNTAASGGSQITKSDEKYYACDGDIAITLNGGVFRGCEISAFQNSSVYTMLLRGNYDLTVSAGASLAFGMVLDATQVKGYAGSDSRAALTCPAGANVVVKRFDIVNGVPQTYDEPLRIACVGDSITEGNSSGSRQTLSYPAQLLTRLHGSGRDVILGNYGCSATRVENYSGQHYNDMLAYTLALTSDADYFIIGLGTNDAGVIQGGYSQMKRFYDEYTQLLRDFGELATTKKVFATTATHRPSALGYGAISVRAQQIKAAEALAKTSDKYVLVDLYALTLGQALAGNFLSSDDLHPHAAGYGIYVDVLLDAIFNGVCRLDGFESEDIYLSAAGTANMEATAANPTNSLMVALAKAAPHATLHIIGVYDAELGDKNYNLATPPVESFAIVGEGEGAKLVSNSKFFLAQSDITLDNFLLTTSSANSILIQLGYHNATLTESFKTEQNHYANLLCGYVTYAANPASAYHTIAGNIVTGGNCTVNVRGGNYAYVSGGNYMFNSSAVVGTFTGNLTLNIGAGVTFQDISYNTGGRYSGAVGQNYLTGSVTMNVGAWHTTYPIREHEIPPVLHDYEKNTGIVTIHKAEDLTNEIIVTGDFSGNGVLDLADALLLVRSILDQNFNKSAYLYGRTTVDLIDALRLLKNLAS